MKRTLFALGAVLALVIMSAAPASAVTYGVPDAGEHPYVGLVVFYSGVDDDGDPIPSHRCSGTLLSSRAFLTAGHCTTGMDLAQVYMEEDVSTNKGYPFTGGTLGKPVAHPGYDDLATFPNTSDVGIVLLNKPIKMNQYGILADVGALDDLATERGQQDITFEVVGYGLQGVKPDFMAFRQRYKAESKLNNLTSSINDGWNLQTSNAPGIGGGTCSGDSGGPVFFNNTNVIVAVTSFGLNTNCKGNDFSYRTDTSWAQDFILSYL